jgi:hypothetical protein
MLRVFAEIKIRTFYFGAMIMEHEIEATHITQLISDALEMPQGEFDSDQPPHFDEIARVYRNNNQTSEEIKVLEMAVSFYENPDIQYDERLSMLNKFRAKLNARQKEAKVLEVLGW